MCPEMQVKTFVLRGAVVGGGRFINVDVSSETISEINQMLFYLVFLTEAQK